MSEMKMGKGVFLFSIPGVAASSEDLNEMGEAVWDLQDGKITDIEFRQKIDKMREKYPTLEVNWDAILKDKQA
jgi:hypothetical protein